ncbi:cupin domain-containing protein [Aliiroseovarius crassostreae]|uniref:cupin domain-containing protein n=1 Tax=Aliiroseovarius crassostreae TaxID=154981 RepID=UPI003C7A3194
MCANHDQTCTAIPTTQIDNDRVRVTEWRFPHKGARTGWHRHDYDYVVIPLFNGTLRIELPGDEVVIAELRHGEPYYRELGVEHDVINNNDFECAFVEVELLEAPKR